MPDEDLRVETLLLINSIGAAFFSGLFFSVRTSLLLFRLGYAITHTFPTCKLVKPNTYISPSCLAVVQYS